MALPPADAVELHGRRFVPLLSAVDIATRVGELGRVLTGRFGEGGADAPETSGTAPPVCIGVLNGAAVFHADLARQLNFPCELGFVRTRSYRGMESGGEVAVQLPDDLRWGGRDVILVEDILDSGRTLNRLTDVVLAQAPRSLTTVVLLDKPAARRQAIEADLAGFEIDDRFVVGYGLDYDGLGRNLPAVFVLDAAGVGHP